MNGSRAPLRLPNRSITSIRGLHRRRASMRGRVPCAPRYRRTRARSTLALPRIVFHPLRWRTIYAGLLRKPGDLGLEFADGMRLDATFPSAVEPFIRACAFYAAPAATPDVTGLIVRSAVRCGVIINTCVRCGPSQLSLSSRPHHIAAPGVGVASFVPPGDHVVANIFDSRR